jgi:kynurenine formamidase
MRAGVVGSPLIDLSHTIEDGLITYRGLPAPIICDFLSREDAKHHYADGTSFQIGRIDMVANTGTYIDSPFHRYADGKDLAALELERLTALPGTLVRSRAGERALGPELFAERELAGRAVLIHTGWARHWRTERYFSGHPFLTEAAALLLRDRGAVLVGIDSLNIDDTDDGRRPVHTVLLGADIAIVEHLCRLEAVPEQGFTFHAVPPKVRGLGTFPVRAYAALAPGS